MSKAVWRAAPAVAAVISYLATALPGWETKAEKQSAPEIMPQQALRFAASPTTGRAPVISAVALAGDEKTLLIAGDDHLIRMFDLTAGRVRAELKAHADWVRALAVMPDGKTFYSAGDDHFVRRWDVAAGQPLGEVDRLDSAVYALALSTDGKQLAAAGFQDELRIYDTANNRLVHRIRCHTRDLRAIAFSPDGRQIAVAGRGGTVAIWSLTGNEPTTVGEIAAHRQRVRSLAWSSDGTRLLSASEDGMVRLWNAATREQVFEIACRPAKVMSAMFVSAEMIATGGSDNRVLLWDLKTLTPMLALRGHNGSVAALACDRQGKLIVSGGYDTTVQIYNLTREAVEQVRTGQTSPPTATK